MSSENKNILLNSPIQFSQELIPMVENLNHLEIAPDVPDRLWPLLKHLTGKVGNALKKMEGRGSELKIYGPAWCRENSRLAGPAHAEIIVETYGTTYALPNKDPEVNIKALDSGDLDMYLIFEDGKPVGTTCMVIQPNGWAELGRSASLGAVGNRAIQDLRIIGWLTEKDQAEKSFGIFSTCRTAPDRNIGTEQNPEMMRGGQAVTHMWAQFPGVMVGGFGPLYKKHGALEQFAYAFVTNKDSFVPLEPQVFDLKDRQFVREWSSYYHVLAKDNRDAKQLGVTSYSSHYPPLETNLTHLIHGEITLEEGGESFKTLDEAISRLNEVRVPFIQVQIPIDVDSKKLQEDIINRGFQAFLFTPGVINKQPPLLWFGKVTKGVSVVPTFWQDLGDQNPFWSPKLSDFATFVVQKW